MSYQAFALLPPQAMASTDELGPRLAAKVGTMLGTEAQWVAGGDRSTIRAGDWSLYLALSSAKHVLEESRDIANYYGKDRPDVAIIATCDRRVELWTDPDPDMRYFNGYVVALEMLETIPGAILFDPQGQEFI